MKKFYTIGFVKLLLVLAFTINSFNLYSQSNNVSSLSLDSLFETVFDSYGSQLSLSDILINGQNTNEFRTTLVDGCSTTSYFNLYFENGSGMEDTSNPIHNARRAVICKVFEDISNFINSPLTITGNKVNIWIRSINSVTNNSSNGVLGVASGFYVMPSSPTNGGIVDNEIWKTIHTGVDSFTNVFTPLSSNGLSSSSSSIFYHGYVAFNFNTNSTPVVNWHTNLSTLATTGTNDLYSVALHEITHALGFGSLINQNGTSKFTANFQYFSRYDTFLKNNNGSQSLIRNKNQCGVMYNYSFNSNLFPSILRPGCSLPNNLNPPSNPSSNQTICNNAIKYIGGVTIPVYTPTCFELSSSLSHFEDQLFPNCTFPNGNDLYFAMSNAASNLVLNKRFLKSEERRVLCDIGYNVNSSYGSTSTANGFINYSSTPVCGGINVAGINDGINPDNTYSFIGNQGTDIIISGNIILSNDTDTAVGFECLQSLRFASTLSTTNGNANTNIIFNSSIPGLHLLRYVPINAAGQRGNITYVYVKVIQTGTCAVPTACNLVSNGNFEQFSLLPDSVQQITRACGWQSANMATPDYFHSSTNGSSVDIPCNYIGFQNSNNNVGNAYAGILITNNLIDDHRWYENIYTQLSTPLLPNTTYQLSFDVSLSESYSFNANRIQAYLSKQVLVQLPNTRDLSLPPNTLPLTNPIFARNFNGWDRVTFTFTTNSNGGEEYLYIGGIQNVDISPNVPAGTTSGCSYQSSTSFEYRPTYYYLDNIVLLPTNGASFNLPATICSTASLLNLTSYLSNVPTNGVFSGMGVTLTVGVYGFNANLSAIGQTIINYTFNNSLGCPITISDTINILPSGIAVANNDSVTSFLSTSSQTPITNILFNDTINGNLIDINNINFTVSQTGAVPVFSSGGIIINPNGTLTILPNTPVGNYVLYYRILSSCSSSNSNIATINVKITPYVNVPSKGGIAVCYNSSAQNTSLNVFSILSNGGFPVTVGGVIASSANSTISTASMPGNIILNSNGTFTVAGSTLPANYLFTITICPIGNPTAACSSPINFSLIVDSTIYATNDTITLNQIGTPCSECNNNILTNDLINCPVMLPATTLNTTITNMTSPPNAYLSINSLGNIVLSQPTIPVGTYTLNYKLCDTLNPTICKTASVTVYIVNNFRMVDQNYIKQSNLDTVFIYPNPSNGIFNIDFKNQLERATTIAIYNIVGQKIYTKEINETDKLLLDLSNYSSGTYLVRFSDDENTISKKLIKQ